MLLPGSEFIAEESRGLRLEFVDKRDPSARAGASGCPAVSRGNERGTCLEDWIGGAVPLNVLDSGRVGFGFMSSGGRTAKRRDCIVRGDGGLEIMRRTGNFPGDFEMGAGGCAWTIRRCD